MKKYGTKNRELEQTKEDMVTRNVCKYDLDTFQERTIIGLNKKQGSYFFLFLLPGHKGRNYFHDFSRFHDS